MTIKTNNKPNLGTLTSSPVSKNAFIPIIGDRASSSDYSADVYQFKIASSSDLNLALTNMGNSNFANLSLYLDDGNGSFDPQKDQLLQYRNFSGDHDETINTRVNPGTYFAVVASDSYNYYRTGNAPYNLALSATSPTAPNNLLAKEVVLDTLSGSFSKIGYVSDDIGSGNTSDTYFFTLGSKAKVDIILGGLSNDADIRLIQDRNKNGIVDAGEEIKYPKTRGTSSETISVNLQGDYFLQVNQYNIGDTSYTLNFNYTKL